MSDSSMDPPTRSGQRGLEVGEEPLRQITGWDIQAAFGCQIVCLRTDAGVDCYAITHERTAELLAELGDLLDRQIRAAMSGQLEALN